MDAGENLNLVPQQQQQRKIERKHPCGTCLAVALVLTTISCVPPAVKTVLSLHALRLPLTLATAQVGGAALLFWVVRFARCSWSQVRWRDATPVGVVFGIKIALMNVGLAGSSTLAHVLFQATDVLWAAAFARVICGEPIGSVAGFVALAGCFVGTTLFTVAHAARSRDPLSVVALAANLAAPALQGLVIALLRSGVVAATLSTRKRRASWNVLVDFTATKLLSAALSAAALAGLVEGRTSLRELRQWRDIPAPALTAILLATLLVACVQFSFTFLSSVVSAPTVGVVAALKVVPQVALASAIAARAGQDVSWRPTQIAGATLLLFSAVLWAVRQFRKAPKRRTPSSFLLCAILFFFWWEMLAFLGSFR
ncbi:hypothetical protein CTAYLR_001094 [Chrysophaeum taylorii]|uniref:Uncharacterized protein n=1 Tax=Chrysophaeum taylorii TaxID=2483200 RepID=A0AAD7UPM3_9STRA|nr:hypothetical protein CTAYLR_001094 [Chrysophaeum taylorii]